MRQAGCSACPASAFSADWRDSSNFRCMDASGRLAMRNVYALLLVSIWLSPSVFAQSEEDKSFWPIWGGSSRSDSDLSNSRESSVFNNPGKKDSENADLFQFPGWSAPKWPGVPTFSGLRQKTSRTMKSARNTTRRWWNGTKEFLSPYPSDDDSQNSEPSSGNSWFGWFGRKQEEPEIATVNDFLRQERPRF